MVNPKPVNYSKLEQDAFDRERQRRIDNMAKRAKYEIVNIERATKDPSNPSKHATAHCMKFKTLPVPKVCPNCMWPVRWSNNSEIYGRSYGQWPFVYQCTNCDSYVGMHPGTAIPLGTLADSFTRFARKEAKAVFNASWQSSDFTRTQAYEALAARLGILLEDCHFAWFDIDMCGRVIAIINGGN